MDIQKLAEKWMPLQPVLRNGLHEVLSIQHLAAQLIAVTGEHLIPPREDNSHKAMEFSASRKMLIGEKIPGEKTIRAGFNIKDLTLYILSSRMDILEMGDLAGHTTSEGFNFFKKHLSSYGVDVSNFDLTIDYNLSTGPVKKEHSFTVEYPDIGEETVKYRANAKFLLQFFNRVFKNTSDIRVWPHNFCTSSKIYSGFNSDGLAHNTIEYGFSPQDGDLDDAHFYVRYTSGREFVHPGPAPELKGGGHWDTEKLRGAYLPVSEVWSHSDPFEQFNITSEFFASAIEASQKIMGG